MIASSFPPSDATHYTTPTVDEYVAVWVRRHQRKKRPTPRFTPPEPPAWPPPRAPRAAIRGRSRPPVIRKQPRMRAERNKVRVRIQGETKKGDA